MPPSMMFLIAPKTGHDMHPESRKTLNAFLYERIKTGAPESRPHSVPNLHDALQP